jgi:azurin
MQFNKSYFIRGLALSSFGVFLISFSIRPYTAEQDIFEEDMAVSLCSSSPNRPFETVIDLSRYADTVLVDMMTEGVELSYSVSEIRAKAGSVLHIRYINKSDMSHNIVFVKEEDDIRPVGIAALQAMASDWIPPQEMDRIFAHSELAYSGDTVSVFVTVPPPGSYPYICTYSAHWTQMQGRLISIK